MQPLRPTAGGLAIQPAGQPAADRRLVIQPAAGGNTAAIQPTASRQATASVARPAAQLAGGGRSLHEHLSHHAGRAGVSPQVGRLSLRERAAGGQLGARPVGRGVEELVRRHRAVQLLSHLTAEAGEEERQPQSVVGKAEHHRREHRVNGRRDNKKAAETRFDRADGR